VRLLSSIPMNMLVVSLVYLRFGAVARYLTSAEG
jgi:hypothetical protein